jgi:hypothetical protein
MSKKSLIVVLYHSHKLLEFNCIKFHEMASVLGLINAERVYVYVPLSLDSSMKDFFFKLN